MVRSKSFHPSHEPFQRQRSIQLQDSHVSGPLPFLNPTRARFRHTLIAYDASNEDLNALPANGDEARPARETQHVTNTEFEWRSRDNRKGRHALVVQPLIISQAHIAPKPTSTLQETGKGILRMVTQYPYWDVSYLVATIFTLGSVIWIMNAFFAFLPLAQPQTEFDTEILYGGGITAFLGATVFEAGSVLLMLEAVNENRTGCFGWALEELFEGNEEKGREVRLRPDKMGCLHHHTNKQNLIVKSNGWCPSTQDSSRL